MGKFTVRVITRDDNKTNDFTFNGYNWAKKIYNFAKKDFLLKNIFLKIYLIDESNGKILFQDEYKETK